LAVRFHVELYKTETGYNALSPEVPGCIAAADTLEATEQLIAEAIQFHLNLDALPELDFKICA